MDAPPPFAVLYKPAGPRQVSAEELERTAEKLRLERRADVYVREQLDRLLSWADKPLVDAEGFVKCCVVSNLAATPRHRRGAMHTSIYWNPKNVRPKPSKVLFHRLVYDLFREDVPPELLVLHDCRGNFGSCINPAHLKLGTQADNMRDTIRDGTARKTTSHILEENEVRQIRAQYNSGASTMAALGRKYGVTIWSIRQVVRRESYKYVE